jgi:MinD superfamily P-loop ATPase
MKELVVLSGKGGTGKTSIAALLASLMKKPVIVDGDVDASNLHLLLHPVVEESYDFVEGAKAKIDSAVCTGCGRCVVLCRFDAIHLQGVASVNAIHCEGCGVCARLCPENAISIQPQSCGRWFLSRTDFGPMVHARLNPGEENSGKLISALREWAKAIAGRDHASWILVDGPPGTGCPVISSVTGADYVLMVTEPTVSGVADLHRTIAVTDHFHIPVGIVINRADINHEVATQIEKYATSSGRDLLGRIDYDQAFTQAQLTGSPVLSLASPKLRQQLCNMRDRVELKVKEKIMPVLSSPVAALLEEENRNMNRHSQNR